MSHQKNNKKYYGILYWVSRNTVRSLKFMEFDPPPIMEIPKFFLNFKFVETE